jgi:PPOX class probable F420-dependent enzyme
LYSARAGSVPAAYDRIVIDEGTGFGAKVARRLREEIVVWLTTVSPAGRPLPMPVWFIWDGAETIRVYSRDGARVRNLAANPNVTLNFDGDGRGGDIVVLSGEATLDRGGVSADRDDTYLEKYRSHIARIGHQPGSFAEQYSVPVSIRLVRVRGH